MHIIQTAAGFFGNDKPKKPPKVQRTDYSQTKTALQYVAVQLRNLSEKPLPADIIKALQDLSTACQNFPRSIGNGIAHVSVVLDGDGATVSTFDIQTGVAKKSGEAILSLIDSGQQRDAAGEAISGWYGFDGDGVKLSEMLVRVLGRVKAGDLADVALDRVMQESAPSVTQASVVAFQAPPGAGGDGGDGADGNQPTFYLSRHRNMMEELNDWVIARVGILLPDYVAEPGSAEPGDGFYEGQFFPRSKEREIRELLESEPDYDDFFSQPDGEEAYDKAMAEHFSRLKELGYFSFSVHFKRLDLDGKTEDDLFAEHGLRSNFADAVQQWKAGQDVVAITINKA